VIVQFSMKRICLIHQQQGLGDLLYIQKIVRKYSDDGFVVICPILNQHKIVRDCLSSESARYPLISEKSVLLETFDFAREHIYLVTQCETHFGDSLFTRPVDTGDFIFLALGPSYKRLTGDGLMRSKYRLAGVDPSGWQSFVTIKRNLAKEHSLLKLLGLDESREYTLVNEYSSNGRIEIEDPGDAVYMRQIKGYTLFDWLSVLAGCTRLVTVDTSLVLLAEIFLKKTIPAYLISKWPTGEPSYIGFQPDLELHWIFAPHASDLKFD
jgi:hypothetical protein